MIIAAFSQKTENVKLFSQTVGWQIQQKLELGALSLIFEFLFQY